MANTDEKQHAVEFYGQSLNRYDRIQETDFVIRAGLSQSENLTITDYENAERVKSYIVRELKSSKEVTIGRNQLAHIAPQTIEDWPSMSRNHTRISLEDGIVKIEDLDSSHGTFVKMGHQKTYSQLKNDTAVTTDFPVSIGIPIIEADLSGSFFFEITSIEKLDKVEKLRPVDSGHTRKASADHRETCEDDYLDQPKLGLYGVFDGVSAHTVKGKTELLRNGNVASLTASESIKKTFTSHRKPDSLEKARILVEQSLSDASRAINTKSKERPEFEGMLTTASVVYVHEQNDERIAVIGNIGDSRVYMYRGGELVALTLDDNVLTEHAAKNEWSVKETSWLQREISNAKTVEDIRRIENSAIMKSLNNPLNNGALVNMWEKHKFSLITEALGDTQIKPAAITQKIRAGDMLLIVSDGVTGCSDNLTETDLQRLIERNKNLSAEELSQLLVEEAQRIGMSNSERAKSDDTTAVVVKF